MTEKNKLNAPDGAAPSAPPDAVAVLRAARELVQRGWTQGWYARDKTGRAVGWDHPEASCWCASGAIYKAVGVSFTHLTQITTPQRALMEDCAKAVSGGYTPEWNDD